MPPLGNLNNKNFILALDGISDPGNLGTILRTALALGWDGVFITSNSTDPFNEKALRAAKGATFRLPILCGSWEELEQLIKKNNLHVFIADMQGSALNKEVIQTPLVLILGNEAHGASAFLKKHYHSISIPISDKMESLNVAIAGGILMHAFKTK
jgi:RNA methyltransferase, TrmH family